MLREIITITPFTRINDRFLISTSLNESISNLSVNDINIDNAANQIESRYQYQKLQTSFLYVCTETVFNYPHPYLTEKSYKGITAKRPFVILGAPGSLSLLQDYGFKTFSKWWNEDYDSELNCSLRLEKVHSIIQTICKLPISDLQTLCGDMTNTLEYNFAHYYNFTQQQINRFNEQCLRNLSR